MIPGAVPAASPGGAGDAVQLYLNLLKGCLAGSAYAERSLYARLVQQLNASLAGGGPPSSED